MKHRIYQMNTPRQGYQWAREQYQELHEYIQLAQTMIREGLYQHDAIRAQQLRDIDILQQLDTTILHNITSLQRIQQEKKRSLTFAQQKGWIDSIAVPLYQTIQQCYEQCEKSYRVSDEYRSAHDIAKVWGIDFWQRGTAIIASDIEYVCNFDSCLVDATEESWEHFVRYMNVTDLLDYMPEELIPRYAGILSAAHDILWQDNSMETFTDVYETYVVKPINTIHALGNIWMDVLKQRIHTFAILLRYYEQISKALVLEAAVYMDSTVFQEALLQEIYRIPGREIVLIVSDGRIDGQQRQMLEAVVGETVRILVNEKGGEEEDSVLIQNILGNPTLDIGFNDDTPYEYYILSNLTADEYRRLPLARQAVKGLVIF